MLIEKVWAENFRNFRKFGRRDRPIRFNTDGKVNLIYGKSGFGKSTILQLLQWILYGRCEFSEDDLVNSGVRKDADIGSDVTLYGSLTILVDGIRYYIQRRWLFLKQPGGGLRRKKKKDKNDQEHPEEYFTIEKENPDGSATPIQGEKGDEGREFIDRIMPQGLAGYFFFDGEQFIDRFEDSKNSNGKRLKEAIATLFQTDVYNVAKELLSGSAWSVSGMLDKGLSEARYSGFKGLEEAREAEEQAKNSFHRAEQMCELRRQEAKSEQKEMLVLSETLKDIPNQEDLKRRINDLEKEQESLRRQYDDLLLKIAASARSHFMSFAVAKNVVDAVRMKPDEIGDQEVPASLTKELIECLEEKEECICGHRIGKLEREQLERWLTALPPASYRPTYDSYLERKDSAVEHELERGFRDLHSLVEELVAKEERIRVLANKLKEAWERQRAGFDADAESKWKRLRALQEKVKKTNDSIGELSAEADRKKHIWEAARKRFDEALRQANIARKERYALSLSNEVAELFEALAKQRTLNVRTDLQQAIEEYLNKILVGAVKTAELSEDFKLTIREGDITYKSRGQAAVACYSYVLGILAVLKRFRDRHEDDILDLSDEYPLVIDAPFSETDREQTLHALSYFREIPKQIVLMSNRDLNDMVEEVDAGTIYVIKGVGVDAFIEECSYEDVDRYFAEGGEKED